AEVVQRDIGRRRARAWFGDDDVDSLAERRQQQRRVVGYARPGRRERRGVRDPHSLVSASTHASHVTRAATALPALPHAFASSACAVTYVHALPSSAASGATTSPVSWSCTTSSGPPESEVVTTGFCDRNASYGTIPKSSSIGA